MHISLDIETLGVTENATVLSIGAVAFDDARMHDGMHVYLDVDSQFAAGRTAQYDTLRWMIGNTQETFLAQPKLPVMDALKQLSEYCAAYMDGDSTVWAKSPDFDCVLLRTLYRRFRLPEPWRFWQTRCIRTALMFVSEPVFAGDKHNALDDAKHQAHIAQAFMKLC